MKKLLVILSALCALLLICPALAEADDPFTLRFERDGNFNFCSSFFSRSAYADLIEGFDPGEGAVQAPEWEVTMTDLAGNPVDQVRSSEELYTAKKIFARNNVMATLPYGDYICTVKCTWYGVTKTATARLHREENPYGDPTGIGGISKMYTMKAGESVQISPHMLPEGWKTPFDEAIMNASINNLYIDNIYSEKVSVYGDSDGAFAMEPAKDGLGFILTAYKPGNYTITFYARFEDAYYIPSVTVPVQVSEGDAPPVANGLPIDEAHFPDAVFREYVASNLDGDKDGGLSEAELGKVKRLYLYDMGIESLEGVQYFTSLESLECKKNRISALPIEDMTSLTYLECSANQLTELNVSKLVNLGGLYCYSNQLTRLDTHTLTNLEQLYCDQNQLTELIIGDLPKLEKLSCSRNKLKQLDIGHLTSLTSVICENNELSELAVGGLTNLSTLRAARNRLSELNVENLTGLTVLNCQNNMLAAVNVENLTNMLPDRFSCGENKHPVTAENGRLDLTTLPHFNPAKASNWQGGTVNGNILTVKEDGEVTYTYDCGGGYSETFTLAVTVTGQPAEDPVNKPGNVTGDGDGTVDGRDMLRLARYFAGQDVAINEKAADVNGDGVVDGRDLLRLARYLAGQDVELKSAGN